MKRNLLFATLLILVVSGTAFAQMGGGHHGPGPGQQPGTPPANTPMGPGSGMGGFMGGDMGGGMGMFEVADDGTVFLLRGIEARELVAVRPTGTIAWSTALDQGFGHFELSGTLLVVATSPRGRNPDGTFVEDLKTTIAGYSVASGSKQWTLEVDGHVGHLEAGVNGTYAIVNDTGSRSLILIGNDGKVVWSLTIN